MSPAFPPKDQRVLIAALKRQGAQVDRTTSGYRILFPNGETTAFHSTMSDSRGVKNLRASIRRNGMIWPNDPSAKRPARKKKSMHIITDPEKYPPYLTKPAGHITVETRRRFEAALEQVGDVIHASTVSRLMGESGKSSSSKAGRLLYVYGYRWVDNGASRDRQWALPPQEEPEPRKPIDIEYEPWVEPEPEAAVASEPEVQAGIEGVDTAEPQPHGYVEQDVDSAVVGARENPDDALVSTKALGPQHEYEFIDDRDSYVVHPEDQTTYGELRRYATMLGLNLEVRAWRSKGSS